MPELPEVETIVRTLKKSLLNETIQAIQLKYQPLLEVQSDYDVDALVGATFTQFRRRGKYLWFSFSNGLHWILHLRMEGKFHLYKHKHKTNDHTHLTFKTEHHHVHYLDTRKFSRMAIVKDPVVYLKTKRLGFEPWDKQLTGGYLYEKFQKTQRVIKNVLLDQSIVTGIGNIYADEILFSLRLHPMTPACKISKRKANEMVKTTQDVLEMAIMAGGTTIRSYTFGLNLNGRFQVALNAYGQANKPCVRCQTTMKRIVISGRSSVFCPKCQKERP